MQFLKCFTDANNDWPAAQLAMLGNKDLKILDAFLSVRTSLFATGMNQVASQRPLDQIGYK